MTERVFLYDTTLRDGAQTTGVDFDLDDKFTIARALDRLGVDYVEGGWPGANPVDETFFRDPPKLSTSKLVAFGMTRRALASAQEDLGLSRLVKCKADALCLVGKTWDFHVRSALEVSLSNNFEMIADSVAFLSRHKEVIFDAEHFFDGFKSDRDYALACLSAAYDAGANWLVLCDTNGGTLPEEIRDIVAVVCARFPGDVIGIHSHNDCDMAEANSLAAVSAGARQIQGTLCGLGERCGNANLLSLIPTLKFKTDFACEIETSQTAGITELSRWLCQRLDWPIPANAPRAWSSNGVDVPKP